MKTRAVIHELTQGLQMAQQLRVHLHSPKARDFYIQMILSSYYNALCVLRSGHSIEPAQLPVLPKSLISFERSGTKELKGENVIPRKRKESTAWEDQVRICKVQKCFATKQMQDVDPRVFTQPEKRDIKPTYDQLTPPSPGKMLSNLRANLSVNTSDLCDGSGVISTLSSFPSISIGANYYDYESTPIYSPVFISPVTSESTIFTEWGSSQSLEFLADPADVDTDFDFDNSLF